MYFLWKKSEKNYVLKNWNILSEPIIYAAKYLWFHYNLLVFLHLHTEKSSDPDYSCAFVISWPSLLFCRNKNNLLITVIWGKHKYNVSYLKVDDFHSTATNILEMTKLKVTFD